jgi:predicted  nucleic acid-binding Zn-ribbon protein
LNAKPRIESYNEQLIELQKQEEHYSKAEYLKHKHDFEAKRERYQSTLVEASNFENTKIKIQSRLEDLKLQRKSLVVANRKSLGLDQEGNEYFVSKRLIVSSLKA